MRRTLLAAAAILVAFGASVANAAGRWGEGYLPNVKVVDQNGKVLRFYDDVIKNKIVVVSFIYTSCTDICPLVTARLAMVQEKLADVMGKGVEFVSITIDPTVDTPKRLKEHAQAFGAGPGWTFLTGAPDDIDQIRFKLGERSREKLSDHRNEILLGNDRVGEWERNSAFADITVLSMAIRAMDPDMRNKAVASDIEVDAIKKAATTQKPADLPGQSMFTKACASCHTVGGGDRIGPDLAGLTKRRDRDWLIRYLTGPDRMRRQGDPALLALIERFPTVRMPNLSLAPTDAEDLIAFVEMQTYAAAKSADASGRPVPHQHRD